MIDWRQWREMSVESLEAARSVERYHPRSSVSRYYYAAYQQVTAVLHYHGGLVPPDNREAWKHKDTPDMIAAHFRRFISRRVVNGLINELTYLYQLRIYSDYVSNVIVLNQVKDARKSSLYIISVCVKILEESDE